MTHSEKTPSYFRNWWSVLGAIGAVFSTSVIIFLIVLDYLSQRSNPYLQAVTYLVVPGFLVVSLLIIPLGALYERNRRVKKGRGVRKFPSIDFNNPVHQRWAFATIAVTTFFLLFSFFGIYRTYEFTESTTFCGMMCHQVMEPEHTAYQNSPHARVACVECHIGPGADWYVKSKLSGMYQIYSAFAHKYSRPIKTPVENLRPAQETCEACHWPKAFFGAVEQDHEYFLPDEANTPWKTRMLIYVGGGDAMHQKAQGIHWHMSIKNKIYYVPEDPKRQVIPWVRKVGPDGKETIYVTEGSDYSATQPPKNEERRMDCVDCHNRPSHNYKAPTRIINEALSSGKMDRTLPYLKREAVSALIGHYETKEAAAQGIRAHLENFYKENYPDLWSGKKDRIEEAVLTVQTLYSLNFFPYMKVSWKAYPDNIGHMNFSGCFRCHDGNHKASDGSVISNSCTSCHAIIAQGIPGQMEQNVDGLEFKHPEDIGDTWKEMQCTDCHDGTHA